MSAHAGQGHETDRVLSAAGQQCVAVLMSESLRLVRFVHPRRSNPHNTWTERTIALDDILEVHLRPPRFGRHGCVTVQLRPQNGHEPEKVRFTFDRAQLPDMRTLVNATLSTTPPH